jgi:prepilin-type N-terminal cleavage/methylation domain-containing protein
MRAFTLVELLVVIGIIALLISILLPSLARVREQANVIKCAANLRSVGQSVQLFANEHEGRVPHGMVSPSGVGGGFWLDLFYAKDFFKLRDKYGMTEQLLVCPSNLPSRDAPFSDFGIYYGEWAPLSKDPEVFQQEISSWPETVRRTSVTDWPWRPSNSITHVQMESYVYFGANTMMRPNSPAPFPRDYEVDRLGKKLKSNVAGNNTNPPLMADKAFRQNGVGRSNHISVKGRWEVIGESISPSSIFPGWSVMSVQRHVNAPRINVLRVDGSVENRPEPERDSFYSSGSGYFFR